MGGGDKSGGYPGPLLSGIGNYRDWRRSFKAFALIKKCAIALEPVEGKEPALTELAAQEADALCKAYLTLSVEAHIRDEVESATSAYAAWQNLSALFTAHSAAGYAQEIERYHTMKQGPTEDLLTFKFRLSECVSNLAAAGQAPTPNQQAIRFLNGLRKEDYKEARRVLLIDDAKAAALTITTALPSLLLVERELDPPSGGGGGGGGASGAFVTTAGMRPGGAKPKPKAKPGKDKDKGTIAQRSCWKCGSTSHLKRDCPERAERATDARGANAQGLFAALGASTAMRADGAAFQPNLAPGYEAWVIDTGAGWHMTNSAAGLSCLEPCSVKLAVADGRVLTARQKGTLTLESNLGATITLCDVAYVPDAATSLLCVGRAAAGGAELRANATGAHITWRDPVTGSPAALKGYTHEYVYWSPFKRVMQARGAAPALALAGGARDVQEPLRAPNALRSERARSVLRNRARLQSG